MPSLMAWSTPFASAAAVAAEISSAGRISLGPVQEAGPWESETQGDHRVSSKAVDYGRRGNL